MNKISHTIIFFFICLQLGSGQTEDFQKAGESYKAQKWDAAIQQYESILEKGEHSAELYYNLGNTYFKKNQLAKSIVNYERGLILDKHNEDILYNLGLAKALCKDEIPIVEPFFLTRIWKDWRDVFSGFTWGMLALLFFWITIGCVLLYMLKSERKLKMIGFFGGILFFILSLFTLFLSLDRSQYEDQSNRVILLDIEVVLRIAPEDGAKEIETLHEGLEIKVIDQIGEWYKVKLSNGDEGWLPILSVEMI